MANITIGQFNERFQQYYRNGSAPEYAAPVKTGPDHCPLVTVELTVPWGSFEGAGSNQRVARADAVQQAFDDANCPFGI